MPDHHEGESDLVKDLSVCAEVCLPGKETIQLATKVILPRKFKQVRKSKKQRKKKIFAMVVTL